MWGIFELEYFWDSPLAWINDEDRFLVGILTDISFNSLFLSNSVVFTILLHKLETEGDIAISRITIDGLKWLSFRIDYVVVLLFVLVL